MAHQDENRRQFLKVGGMSIFAAMVGGKTLLKASVVAAADPAPQMVQENDPQAKALGYHADAKKVDTKKFPKRAGAAGAKQLCNNCEFFQAKADAKTAACTLFGMKHVAGAGWCNSWVEKTAKAKS